MAVNELKIAKKYNIKISSSKTETIGLCGKTYKVSKQKLMAKS
jgi:hypothetical protein